MRITQLALALWLGGAVAQGSEPPRNLAVYVQVETPDRMTLVPLAKHLAGKMFAAIGVSVEWKATADGPAEPIFIEITSEAPEALMPGVLGYSVLHTSNRITIFLSRIENMEIPATVLAHVMVHEITHVLQGIGRHSETGVMQARWSGRDYCEMRRKPLPFAPEDLDMIYEGLAKRQGLAGTLDLMP